MGRVAIALDGPAGAGKSTLAKGAAKRFRYIYVDTGALYRCVGLFVLRNGVKSKDEAGILQLLPKINLEMRYDTNGNQRMLLNDEDVTDEIRTPDASIYASDVSAISGVRAFLLSMQREMAEKYDVIMDGRDIGTVVLPNAGLKVFLVADAEIRAKRRHKELLERGVDVTFEDVFQDMILRDKNDSEREVAPLKPSEDAITLDTTILNLEQSLDAFCRIITERIILP